MVEGSPLHYYHPYPYTAGVPLSRFPLSHRYGVSPKPRGMSEEFQIPHSPNSTQSESDNSLSSTEIPTEHNQKPEMLYNSAAEEKAKAQCCWRSCGIVFESLDQLSDHVSKVHASSGLGGLYYCGWEGCARNNKGFNARYKMLVHVRTHTNEKPHQCTQCNKSFSRAENLKIHSRSHSGEKPYVCPVPGCNKAYSNSSDRFKHTRTHQVDKPYQCKVPGCPKRYTDPSSLRKHVKTYKHFVNENNQITQINNENEKKDFTEEKMQIEERIYNSANLNKPMEDNYQITQPCTCNHSCYVTKCLNLGALINLKVNTVEPWNNFIEPFLNEPKRIYMSPYDLTPEHIDVDVPLDLSIGRKHI